MNLTITDVRKSYGRRMVLDNISLVIHSGEVVGFVGPNGAGKSTSMKIVMGLVHADSGSVEIGGATVSSDKVEFLQRIGGLVDGPSMYPTLNARQHLEYVARMRGLKTDKRIQEVLELVGLAEKSTKSVSRFSMGMKQRLGIAMAILHSPDFLILDEPTNGLDPAAMVEFRGLIRTLKENTVGVLISSHVLAEIERLCDRVVFIRAGKIVKEVRPGQTGMSSTFLVRTTDDALAAELLLACAAVENVAENDSSLTVAIGKNSVTVLAQTLLNGGVGLLEMTPLRQTLEADYLTEFTGTKEFLS